MNDNYLIQLMQQGLRIAVGATASCVETLQNPQKRSALLTEIQTELTQKTQEWSEKGEITEAEARASLDDFLARQGWSQTNTEFSQRSGNSTRDYSRIQELTAEIVELKAELEKFRQEKDSQS